MRDVEPVVAGEPGGGEHVADRVRGQPELVEVQPSVEVAKPQQVRLALVQRRAQRGADARADEAHEVAVHSNERTR
jgi:hypothetical protein